MARVFFALWPDATTRDACVAAADPLLEGRRLRRVPPENYHLTLVFIGEVEAERVAELAAAARGLEAEPHELVIDRVGYFRRARVAWLGPSRLPRALTGLHEALTTRVIRAGFGIEARRFRPHLTIARDCERRLPPPKGMHIRWPVGDFVLCESGSDGRYRIVERFGGPRDG